MIIKASQRSGGTQLGLHLLKTENEQVEIHEVSGFVSETVMGAMKEAQAMAMGTRCKQYLFSVSLNPPETEAVRVEVFEGAIAKIEERLGLEGQPRMVVFHEKEGRRHAHVVWSRIDAETMTAKQLSFYKSKLQEVSRELFLDNGWKMPRGLMAHGERDPRNFTLAEWQQAKRAGLNPHDLKGMVQDCWAVSDNRESFARALEERGLYLAKGDRRGHVAVTYEGEVFALSRLIDRRAKDVTAKLGKPDDLLSVEATKARIANEIAPRVSGYIREAKQNAHAVMIPLKAQATAMAERHRAERDKQEEGQKQRWQAETRERADRLRKGFMGLWDRLTGDYQKTQKSNEVEAFFALQRDREQRQALIAAQMAERQRLQQQIEQARERHAQQILALHRQAASYRQMAESQKAQQQAGSERGNVRSEFSRQSSGRGESERGQDQPRGRSSPDRGPDLGRG